MDILKRLDNINEWYRSAEAKAEDHAWEATLEEFGEVLPHVHSEEYKGTDDDMPQAYDNWLISKDSKELRRLAEDYIDRQYEA